MKKLIPLLILLITIPILWAQDSNSISLQPIPSVVFYNYLNASSLDPQQPGNQTFLFNLNIQNSNVLPYSMKVRFEWNSIQLFETYMEAKSPLSPMTTISNQMLLNSNASIYFHSPDPDLDFQSIIDTSPEFKDAIMNTGRFPDGSYQFIMQAVDVNSHSPLSGEATFHMIIQNMNAIYLQTPGVQIGGLIPTVNALPVPFIWNTVMPNTGGISFDNLDSHAGKFTLTIREFNQVDDINQDNMDNGTIYRVIPDIVGTNFTDYIPFQSDKYYAWQVSIPLVSTDADPQHIPSLKSSWFVFKYSDILSTGGGATGGSSGTGIGMTTPGSITGGGSAGGTGEGTNGGTGEGTGSGSGSGVSGSSTGGTGSGSGSNGTVGGTTPENEIVIILTNLNNPQVSGLLNDGFVPTGNVYVGDQLYSGDGAILQLQKLAGKSIKSITMSDE